MPLFILILFLFRPARGVGSHQVAEPAALPLPDISGKCHLLGSSSAFIRHAILVIVMGEDTYLLEARAAPLKSFTKINCPVPGYWLLWKMLVSRPSIVLIVCVVCQAALFCSHFTSCFILFWFYLVLFWFYFDSYLCRARLYTAQAVPNCHSRVPIRQSCPRFPPHLHDVFVCWIRVNVHLGS
jgi:hypothetical protein